MLNGSSVQAWGCAFVVVVLTPVFLPLLLLFAVMNAPLMVCVMLPGVVVELARIYNHRRSRG